MTLTDKTVGTKETFDSYKIRELLSKGIITNIANLEKAIFCLEYVGQLQEARLDFIFKGGSASFISSKSWFIVKIILPFAVYCLRTSIFTILSPV